jgi:hypothetical protein
MTQIDPELLTKKTVDTFMDKWLNDPSFARQLKADPKAALKTCGMEPSDQLVNSFKDVDKNTPAEELRKRISKARMA